MLELGSTYLHIHVLLNTHTHTHAGSHGEGPTLFKERSRVSEWMLEDSVFAINTLLQYY